VVNKYNINRHNFEAIEHDITVDGSLESGFDLVHTWWLLHHLPEPELAIRRVIDALCPGRWLLLEEVDFFPVHTSTSQLYVDFMLALTANVIRASGRDCLWARALPGLLAGMGLRQVGGEGDFSVLQGVRRLPIFSVTTEQMRERIVGSGELRRGRLGSRWTVVCKS
jgi:hypothetical protein